MAISHRTRNQMKWNWKCRLIKSGATIRKFHLKSIYLVNDTRGRRVYTADPNRIPYSSCAPTADAKEY